MNQTGAKTAVLNFWFGGNYGAVLTAAALCRVLEDLGETPLLIDKPDEFRPWLNGVDLPGSAFIRSHFVCTPRYPRFADYRELNDSVETFVAGSDQIWNVDNLRSAAALRFYALGFVRNDRRKIGCAASFGREPAVSGDLRTEMEFLLHRFDRISVREAEGVEICRNHYGIAAEVLADPVFLCPPETYEAWSDEFNPRPPEQPGIAAYFLVEEPSREQFFTQTCAELNVPGRILLHPLGKPSVAGLFDRAHATRTATVGEWLWQLRHAQLILTDSFHAVCFAILFRRPFIALVNDNARRRIEPLLTALGLRDRMIETPDRARPLWNTPVDFTGPTRKIEEQRTTGKNWLRDALACPADRSADAWDALSPLVEPRSPAPFPAFSQRMKRRIGMVLRRLGVRK